MIADGRDTDSTPIYTTMIPQHSLTKETLFEVHAQVSYIYIYIYIYIYVDVPLIRERQRQSRKFCLVAPCQAEPKQTHKNYIFETYFNGILYTVCEYVDNTNTSRAGYQMTWNSQEIVY